MAERAPWLVGCLMGGYLTSSVWPHLEVEYHHLDDLVKLTLRDYRITQPKTPESDGLALQQALRESRVPELAAIADLIAAHRDEYGELIEAEKVMRALGG